MIESGTVLQDRFLVEGRIGEGGMGAVYLAVDQKFGTKVAVKETFYGDEELAGAFEREARLLNGLHHPIFPHVSDYFSDENGHFLVMEFIEGEDLSVILKRGEVFSVEEVMRWTLDLLDGLDYLHSQDPPVIHRDIKPNNLKLTSRGNIVLLDFGMAKETSGNTLGMRSVFGYSRRYSPLEQIEGTGTDPRSDIFSLGATVYHLLTGKPPVDVLARASAIVAGRLDPLQRASALRPDLPESVAAIIHSSLSLNPEQRFVSARAMWNALEYALGFDYAEERTAPPVNEPEYTAAAPLIVSQQEDFPALDSYRSGSQQDEQPHDFDMNAAAVPPAIVDEVAEEPAVFDGEFESGEDPESDIAVPNDQVQYDDPPLDRAVIHLGTIDEESVPPSADEDEDFADEDHHDRTERIPTAAAGTWTGASVFEALARPAVWIPLLLICAILALFGLAGRTDDPKVQGANTALPAEAPPPAGETVNAEPETAAGAADALPETVAGTTGGDEVVGNDTVAAASEEPVETFMEEDEDEPETAAAAPRTKRAASTATERRQEDREAEQPEREVVEPRAERRNTASRAERPSPPRGQRAGAVRPRIVTPIYNEPSAVTIETVLTGVPYGRRGRGDTDWMDRREEREFRRRLRRMRRQQFRDDLYPPF